MKTSWMGVSVATAITAATVLAPATADAQSSVTLYGIVDVGVQFTNHNVAAGGKAGSTFSAVSGGAQTSRWGLRVREDLGGNYAAIAVLENGFDATKGTANNSGRLFGRSSYVGIDSPYGTFTMGRHVTGVYDFSVWFDPVGPAIYSSVVYDLAFVSRADNSLRYVGKFGVLGGKLMVEQLYSFGYDSVSGAGPVAGAYRVGKEESLFVTYNRGIGTLGLLFDQQNGNAIATQGVKTQRYGVGVSVDLEPVQLYAAYRFYGQKQPGQNLYSSLYWVAARYTIRPDLNVSSDLFYQDDRNTGQGNPLMLSILASYLLSKRTDVYVQLGTILNKKHSSLGFAGFNTVTTGAVQTGAMVGIRTRF
ncbi:porin [Caballeronia sp. LZ043]|uniref:porin n=1 Tax=Caballeronia sp. LZ043 TaxID=3038569 RepID=UPI00285FA91F|nr:porin [Caballeronia sp. LZ043]MDR5825903.1 porin [Caballeronia sp. LZ043]